jgi:hypothetical protein
MNAAFFIALVFKRGVKASDDDALRLLAAGVDTFFLDDASFLLNEWLIRTASDKCLICSCVRSYCSRFSRTVSTCCFCNCATIIWRTALASVTTFGTSTGDGEADVLDKTVDVEEACELVEPGDDSAVEEGEDVGAAGVAWVLLAASDEASMIEARRTSDWERAVMFEAAEDEEVERLVDWSMIGPSDGRSRAPVYEELDDIKWWMEDRYEVNERKDSQCTWEMKTLDERKYTHYLRSDTGF